MAAAVSGGRSPGQIYRRGMPGFFDGNGGMRGAGAWRWHEICGNCEIYERGMGAPRYTPWVCLSQSGMARVIYRRVKQRTRPLLFFFCQAFFSIVNYQRDCL